MKNPEEQKDAYRLWYEYLQEDEEYERVCEAKRNRREYLGVPSQQNWRNFGDVHQNSFDEWWERHPRSPLNKWPSITDRHLLTQTSPPIEVLRGHGPDPLPVDDLFVWFREFLQTSVNGFRHLSKREPTFDELAFYFPQFLKEYEPDLLFVIFNLASEEPLKKTVGRFEILLRKRKNEVNKTFPHFYPKRKVRTAEIRRYLNTYRETRRRENELGRELTQKDHEENVWIMETVRRADPGYKARTDEEIRKELRDNWSKVTIERNQNIERAKNILKAVREGTFPGHYQPKKQSKKC